jgi:hypothetical protein
MKRLPPPSGTLSFESESYFERFDFLVEIQDEQLEACQKLKRGPWFEGSSGELRVLAAQLTPCPKEDQVDSFMRLWPGEDIYEPSRDFVVKRLGLLVGSFPNVAPHSPKVYLNMLVARVMAKHPSCMVLESACNELVDTFKFSTAPTIAELLALIDKHEKLWSARFNADMMVVSGKAREWAEEVAAALEQKEQERVDYMVKGLIEHKHRELADKLKEGGWHMLEEVREEARKLDNEAKLLTHQHSHNGNGKLKQKDYFKEFASKEFAPKRATVQPLYAYSDADDDEGDTDLTKLGV